MIFLPWVAFFVGIFWMIWQGTKSKKEYLRQRKLEEDEKLRITGGEAVRSRVQALDD
jgi:hypothetical protein